MDVKNISYAATYSNTSVDNCYDFTKRAFEAEVKPCILQYPNMHYLKACENSSNHRCDYLFNIDNYENLMLGVSVRTSNSTSGSMFLMLCRKNEDSYLEIKRLTCKIIAGATSRTIVNEDDNTSYSVYDYSLESIGRFITNSSGLLKTIYAMTTTGAADSITFSRDHKNDVCAFTLMNTDAKIYYDSEPAVECTTRKEGGCPLEGMVYKAGLPVLKSNVVNALLQEPVAILNDSLGTNNASASWTLIDVEGVKYRQLSAGFWVLDN